MYQVNKWFVVDILDHNFLRGVLNACLNFYSSQISGNENKLFIGGREFLCQLH